MPPPLRVLIVSGADANFFPLLHDLVLSLRSHKETAGIGFACFDLGLTKEQLEWLATYTDLIAAPEWDLSVPEELRESRQYKAMTARVFLPKYFPGFDIYMWLDADIWVQESFGLLLYIEAASSGSVAATPQVDRAYLQTLRAMYWRYAGFHVAYGQEMADWLMKYPHINNGAFAIRGDVTHWDVLATSLREAIDDSGHVVRANQIAFNHAIYVHRLPVELLPATCNWQCHLRRPIWNEETKRLCEPYIPRDPISMLHLAGKSKNKEYEIWTTSGSRRTMSLRYSLLPADKRQHT